MTFAVDPCAIGARQQCLIQAPAPKQETSPGHGKEILSLRRVAADPGLTRIDPIRQGVVPTFRSTH